MAYTKVAVAGATGNLGPAIVDELIKAGFDVTVLSRSGNTSALPSSVKTIQVDYDSQDSLIPALQGQDALVSNIPNHGGQTPLIDAAIAAGVKRFVPSEFGSNVSGNAKTAKLPAFAGKVATQAYLEKKSSEISYTLVVPGLFLDWGLRVGFWINTKGTTKLYDGGDAKRSTTLLSDVGKAVAGVLKKPEETKNRAVYVQSAAVSQNQLLAIAKKVKPEFEAAVERSDTEQVVEDAYGLLEKGGESVRPANTRFITVSIFNSEYGANWDGKNDNELLGVKELSELELEEVVKRFV